MRKHDQRVRKLLGGQEGSMAPLAVAAAIAMLIIILGVSEYMRLVITAAGVKDALESAAIAVVNDNYNEVYHGVREGYAAGYEPDDTGFMESLDYGTVNVHNTALASPGGTYYVEAGLTIEIPVCFGGKIVSNLSIPLRVRAAYREKF